MLPVVLGAIAGAGNVLLDKFILAKRKMALSDHIPLAFAFLFVTTLVTLPWLGAIDLYLAFNQTYIFYFILMILLAIIWNIFYYQGLQKEKMIEFEMIMLLTPFATIVLAAMFYPEEFNLPVFVAAVIGSVALLLSHVKKHHLEFDKYAMHLLLAVFLMAMEAMVQKELLQLYSPAMLYALRTGTLALFFTIYYRPNLHHIHDKDFRLVFLSSVFGSAYMILRFYGFNQIGVTFTTLILLLIPVLATWGDVRINGTPMRWRTVLAFLIIILCVVYATIQQSAI